MKAAIITKYKQITPMVTEVPVPTIAPTDVLVKIIAASVNPIDLKTKDGDLRLLLQYTMPLIMGSDFAGVITAVGDQVPGFKVGDAVYGRAPKDRIGTFAEFIAIDHQAIALKPANLNFEEAAAIPLVGLTSYQALHDIMNIQPGQKVFIPGGSGGIGIIAIQLAKYFGAYVATTTSAKHFDLVQSLGADKIIDYHQQDFTDVLSHYDAVLDTRGGQSLEAAFQIIKPGGQIVSIAGLPNARFGKDYGLPIWKQWLLGLATRKLSQLEQQAQATYSFLFMQPSGQQLVRLRQLIEQDVIKPVIDQIIPLTDINAALEYSHSGHATGKIIISIQPN
ncbi:NADP-dependent oxidoreductase [Lactiplantibacillus plantarum]|uniref:NADP-dependent oxidoreductase n=1 Tax=Lactiplantibacillus plantarum TaxID=1590 RepID=UPI001080F87D|nr:NADP-dependent oxidoreductase [Lactiplantibacillus plantarum]MCG0631969.1 oxidoreductase [Lactiplantibacillus plantarum]QBX95945.1 NADP-dependent oxidoreductase [Lactiplantibacillus plantarum]